MRWKSPMWHRRCQKISFLNVFFNFWTFLLQKNVILLQKRKYKSNSTYNFNEIFHRLLCYLKQMDNLSSQNYNKGSAKIIQYAESYIIYTLTGDERFYQVFKRILFSHVFNVVDVF